MKEEEEEEEEGNNTHIISTRAQQITKCRENNTRVEHTARAETRYIKNERQTKIQTATSTAGCTKNITDAGP